MWRADRARRRNEDFEIRANAERDSVALHVQIVHIARVPVISMRLGPYRPAYFSGALSNSALQ